MEFRVLGPLEVLRDGAPVAIGSQRQRSLLALLLIHANIVVSTDRILDELWGEDIGADRQNALWVHVSNLRSALEPGRPRRAEGSVVLTQAPGYLARVDPEDLDALRFTSLLREGRALLDTDAAAASVVAGEALALWRGRAYEEFVYDTFAQAEISRLEELRLEAVELRFEADLRRGLGAGIVGELDALVRAHPLRERLTAQLMVALYRSDRTSDALRTYQRLRVHLAEETGLDPSPALQRLESQILAGDPELLAGAGGSPQVARLAVRGYELRDQLDDGVLGPAFRAYQPMVGREVAIRIVRGELADDPNFIRRFEAEAEVIARLEHPHIVPLYDYWREPGAAYLVTRLFRGGTLRDLLRQGPLDTQDAAQMVRDVASALALAHRHGVVHGAVAPDTILVDEERRAYLADFAVVGDDDVIFGRPADARHASPEHLDGRAVTALSDVYGLGATLRDLLDEETPALAEIVRVATAQDPTERYASIVELSAAVDAAMGVAAAEPGISTGEHPYKGLRAFGEADAADFFGRERIVERLVARVGEGGSRGRLVVLVGPSGSGKSSVVRAGLVPAIRSGALPASGDWFVADMTPGDRPFEELAAALRRVAVHPPPDLLDRLQWDETGLRQSLEMLLPDSSAQVLLVVDQLEELFTSTPEPEAREFLDALATAVNATNSRLRVVATLRADFYDRPLEHRSFSELVRRGTEVITPMTADEFERAVSGPAERLGVRVEPALLAEIVRDGAERPAALPLLQYALTEVFDRRSDDILDLATYRRLGGLAGALVQRAEALYGELATDARTTARQVLLRLVAVDDSPGLVRRRVLRSQLVAGLDGERADEVLRRFGECRLLSFDRDAATRAPTVEVAHEALLTEWARLRQWIDDARADLGQQRRLAQRAEEWRFGGHDSGFLLRGSELDRLSAWAGATDLTLAPIERELLDASVTSRDDEHRAEVERSREAERLVRTARQRTRLLMVATAVIAVVAALAAFTVVQRREATRLADQLAAVDDIRRLATAATLAATDDPTLATLLALHAIDMSAEADMSAPAEAEEALHWALQAARIPYPVADAPTATRVGPRGVTGIYQLPLPALVEVARDHVDRTFTPDECERYDIDPCPTDGQSLAAPSASGPRAIPKSASAAVAGGVGSSSLAGTEVTFGGFRDPNPPIAAVHDGFQEATGIDVRYRLSPGDLESGLREADPPDLVAVPAISVRELARQGLLLDLSTFMDVDEARRIWGDTLVDAASVDGGLYALPSDGGLKGLVWYPRPAFDAAGYEVPRTWDDLLALSTRMAADGTSPWCIGLESGGVGPWPATDWLEALVLQVGGVELYDRWVSHAVPFDDPGIVTALSMFGHVVFGDGFVRGGSQTLLRQNIFEAYDSMMFDPPGCWLSFSASYFPNVVGEVGVAGVDYDFFVLPPIEPGSEPAMIGEATMVAAVNDRPEVRALLTAYADPAGVPAWAAGSTDLFIPTHPDVDPTKCASDRLDPATSELRVRLCELMRRAVERDEFRLDGSDAMPPAIGLPDVPENRGAFLVAMADYITRGPDSGEQVLADVEAAWPRG